MILATNVLCAEETNEAWTSLGLRGVDLQDSSMCLRTCHKSAVQSAWRRRDVVCVLSFSTHLCMKLSRREARSMRHSPGDWHSCVGLARPLALGESPHFRQECEPLEWSFAIPLESSSSAVLLSILVSEELRNHQRLILLRKRQLGGQGTMQTKQGPSTENQHQQTREEGRQ